MCGIVYSMSFNGKPVNSTVLGRYKAQRNRGNEGFGFYIPESNRLTHNVRESRIISLLKRDQASEILFHHRFPTSTSNVRNACHPFSTKDTYDHNYVVVHNGVLQNEYKLLDVHESEGIKYVSMQENGQFNDSEALAHDLAQYIEGQVTELTASGSIAFIAIQRKNDGERTALYFGRNQGNPLKMKFTKKSVTISSEGDGVLIEENTLYRWDYAEKRLSMTPMTIPYSTWSSTTTYSNYGNYGGYGAGYNWSNKSGLYDDEDGIEVYNSGFGVVDTRKEFEDEAQAYERSVIKDKVLSLKYDTYENAYDAIELGEDEFDAMKKREKDLELKELADTITDAEIQEYCSLDDELFILERALAVLRQEVLADKQVGFHYTPDSGQRKLAVC